MGGNERGKMYLLNLEILLALFVCLAFSSAFAQTGSPVTQNHGSKPKPNGCTFEDGACVYKFQLSHNQGLCGNSGQATAAGSESQDVISKLGDASAAILKLQAQRDRTEEQVKELHEMVNGLTRIIEAERRNNTKLNNIETLVTNLQQTLQSQSSLVVKLSGQQQGLSTDLQLTKDENKRLAADLKTAKLMLIEMRNKTEIDKIAFAVGRSKSQNLVASTTDIKITFDKIFINHGSNFDNANSLFRAPVAGAYMFTMAMLSNHRSAGRVYLIRNGAYETEMYGSDPVDAATGTNQVILDLKAGDEVWLRLAKGYAIHGNGASVYFTFTGHLLFRI